MRVFLIVAVSAMVATCGQKGPLELPSDEPTALVDAYAQHSPLAITEPNARIETAVNVDRTIT